jgi:hypothetical protein
MKTTIEIFLMLFTFGILITNIFIIFSLRKIIKDFRSSTTALFDEKYYDLKLRIHVLIVTIIIAGFAISFIGWNIQENIIKTVSNDILNQVSNDVGRIKELAKQTELKVASIDSASKNQSQKITLLSSTATELNTSYNNLDALVKSKIQNLKTLISIYIVTGIQLNIYSKPLKLYFKDMKPINASRLPLFKQKPIINIQSDNGLGIDVDQITTEYIIISPSHGNVTEDTPVNGNITIWFIEET